MFNQYDVMAAGPEDQQREAAAKLSDGDPDLFMLAAYCFDLKRKLNYLYIALRQAGGIDLTHPSQGDPIPTDQADLARIIVRETEEVKNAATQWADDTPKNWEARARELEKIIRRQWTQLHEDHENLLAELSR